MFNNLRSNPKFFRYLTNFWALTVYLAIIYDFITNNRLESIRDIFLVIYVAVLFIYASDKEFERWHETYNGRHPGEIFVIGWTILIFAIIVLDFIFAKSYKLPSEVISTYIAVLSILAITKKSKSFYEQHEKEKKLNN